MRRLSRLRCSSPADSRPSRREFERAACAASLTRRPILVHTYMHERGTHTRASTHERYVSSTNAPIVASSPKYRCRGNNGNATCVLYIVSTDAFIVYIIVYISTISAFSVTKQNLSRLLRVSYANCARRQRYFHGISLFISRLISLIIPGIL
jgi:hypothetical protein